MVFSSNIFLFFFLPLTLLGNYLIRHRWRNYFLLIASLFFYGWGEPKFVFVMMLSICMNYAFGRFVDSSEGNRRRGFLAAAMALNIGLLFVFKYLNFIIANINLAAGHEVLTQTHIALPIGISFFTFQSMSYVIDVYRKNTRVQKNLFYLALYVSFFPQLIAGPIVRYEDIAEQMEHRTVTLDGFAGGICRFLLGFNKKILIANAMGAVADKAFGVNRVFLSADFAWLGVVAYAFQIFYDFSGYSDMAIGLGHMFGFNFLENFNYPYISKSVSEFWRRWHISLGTWFREYVYFPLGGSRVKSKARLVFNLFVVWALTGIWHGANWTFLCWGLFYFVLLAFEKLSGYPDKFKNRAAVWLYRGFTLLCVLLSWVLFRAPSLQGALMYLRSMFGLNTPWPNQLASVYFHEFRFFFLLAVLFAIPLKPMILRRISSPWGRTAVEWTSKALLLVGFFLSVASLSTGAYNPFIYFNF